MRILEAGAGTGSSFGSVDGLDRTLLSLTAQDITDSCQHQLASVADVVHLGPLQTLCGQFDIIFSLFVLEHITEPQKFLAEVDRLLAPGGVHFIACPRYDFPGFICPSLRHLRPLDITRIEAARLVTNQFHKVSGAHPTFWINADPALFHRPWVRDADAVHVVSKQSLTSWHAQRGYSAKRLKARSSGYLDWLVKRFLVLFVRFEKAS